MAEVHDPWTLTARWVFPVAGPPMERGTITMQGDCILAVEPRGARTADHDLGNVAILPGLVNTHTHLDLSGMRGLAPPSPDFTGWLRQVIAHRRCRLPEQVQADIQTGLDECLRFGTTLLGDISGDGGSWALLAPAPVAAVVFRELIALRPEQANQAWDQASEWVRAHPPAGCLAGLSPHAPYSVCLPLLVQVSIAAAFLTDPQPLPVAIHLAETRAELELLEHQRGPFVDFLSELGLWPTLGLVDGVHAILEVFSATDPLLLVHGNYLDPAGPIPESATIVYCPRTHAAFGHPPHPFREFLARGIRVALGTDSLASNPDLDLLAEARFLHSRYPDVPGATVLRMATLSGAEALGWADETGSLEPGKSADLVVLPLPDEERADPHDLILQSTQPVQLVLWRGQWRDAAQSAS